MLAQALEHGQPCDGHGEPASPRFVGKLSQFADPEHIIAWHGLAHGVSRRVFSRPLWNISSLKKTTNDKSDILPVARIRVWNLKGKLPRPSVFLEHLAVSEPLPKQV